MMTLFIEGGNYMWAFILVLLIMFLPPIILYIVGFAIQPKKKKTAKILFIIATVYLLISLGICGSMFI